MKHLSVSQLSEVTGVDRRTIKERLVSMKPDVRGRSHLYLAREAIPMILFPDGVDDRKTIEKKIREEELRYESARADKTQLQVEKLRGELVPIEDVAKVVEREYAAVRAAFLAIPSKVSKELATQDSEIGIKRVLEDHINEALSELSADQEVALDSDEEIQEGQEAEDEE